MAGVVYLSIAGGLRWEYRRSAYPYHLLIADAMLHGQLHLRNEAMEPLFRLRRPHVLETVQMLRRADPQISNAQADAMVRRMLRHDLAIVGDRLYGYWAPLTPAAVAPFVAAFGCDLSDDLVSALWGALNVGLWYWVLRRVDRARWLRIGERCAVALTVLFAFGTVHFYMSCTGQVWFAVQIVTITPLLLAIGVAAHARASGRRWLAVGALFGLALLGRNIVVLLGGFFAVAIVAWATAATKEGAGARRQAVRRAAGAMFTFGLPVAAAVGAQLAYNYGRFGSIFEGGQELTARTGGEPRFLANLDRYGTFNLAFLGRNAWYYLLNWHTPRVGDAVWYDPQGNSVFLVTPPLLFVLIALRRRQWLVAAAWAGVLPLLAALLTFRATGFAQFGNRYLLDGMPMLLLLVAAGMGGRLTMPGLALIVAAVGVNVFGTLRFHAATLGPVATRSTPLHIAAAAVVVLTVLVVMRRYVLDGADPDRAGAAT